MGRDQTKVTASQEGVTLEEFTMLSSVGGAAGTAEGALEKAVSLGQKLWKLAGLLF